MKRTITLISTGIVMLIFLALTVSCQGHGIMKNREDMKEFIVFRLTKELNLTEAQQALVEKAMDEVHLKAKELHADQVQHYEEIKSLILAPGITENEINTMLDTRHTKMADIRDLVVKKIVEVHSTFSPEQKEKIVRILEKFKDRMPKDY
jgi:Spy/CpxP family protein refolding chaperone